MQTQTYSRYERARIIGARALQISMGAPLLITTTRIDPLEIAIEEYNNHTIPNNKHSKKTTQTTKYKSSQLPFWKLAAFIKNDSCFCFGSNSLFLSNTLCPSVFTSILIYSINSSISALSGSDIDD